MRMIDLTGKVFGNWTVLSLASTDSTGHPQWLCQCLCGAKAKMLGSNLKRRSKTGTCKLCYTAHNRKRPYESLYNRLSYTATQRGHFVMSYEEFLHFTYGSHCTYCDEKVTWQEFGIRKENNSSAYNLDRRDSSLGYTKENCAVCCGPCNSAKSDRFTYEQFLEIGQLIKKWRDNA